MAERLRHDSIDTIIGAFKAPAMANQFEVSFLGPQGLSLNGVRVKSASIPKREIETAEKITAGKATILPTGKIMDGGTATFNFYCDIEFLDRQILQLWMDSIYAGDLLATDDFEQTQPMFAYYKDYIGKIDIKHLRKDGYNPTWGPEGQQGTSFITSLHDAYPTSINEIELSMDSSEMLNMSVTFAYRYFTTEYTESVEKTRTPHPVYAAERPSPNGLNSGRGQWNGIIEALGVASQYSGAARGLLGKANKLDSTLNKIDNAKKNIKNLFGGG